jgi:hypothetical protein
MRRCECRRGGIGLGGRDGKLRGVRRRVRVRTVVREHAERRCGTAAHHTPPAEGVGAHAVEALGRGQFVCEYASVGGSRAPPRASRRGRRLRG